MSALDLENIKRLLAIYPANYEYGPEIWNVAVAGYVPALLAELESSRTELEELRMKVKAFEHIHGEPFYKTQWPGEKP